MEELKLGRVTNEELAQWFGIEATDKTPSEIFSHNKKRYLKKLEGYCDFKSVRGGVEITKIYKSFYVKNKCYQVVKENFDNTWSSSGLDSCTRVGTQIYSEHYDELSTIKVTTTIKHTAQVRNELYGKPFDEASGLNGSCSYILCKKNDDGQLEFLSPEEENIKKVLLKKWFGDANEKTVIVNQMINNGEITKDEAWNTYSQMLQLPKSYTGFMGDFKAQTGIQLIKGTLIEYTLCAFD